MHLTDFQWDKAQHRRRTQGSLAGVDIASIPFFRKSDIAKFGNGILHFCCKDAAECPHRGQCYVYHCWIKEAPEARITQAFDPDFVPLDISEQPFDFLGY